MTKTERLFWQDAYIREFDAKVESVEEAGVRLDRTAFNPRGGGLVSDVGKLNGADVTEVIKKDEEIYHVLGRRGFVEARRGRPRGHRLGEEAQGDADAHHRAHPQRGRQPRDRAP